MDLSQFVDFVDKWSWLIKFAATLGAISMIWKFIFVPIKKHFFIVKDLLDAVSSSYPILEQISKDFKPNGGNSLRDVVDRIEKNVYLGEQKYKAIVEFQNIGIFETDKDGKYTWVSDKWLEITNQSWLDASNNGWVAQVSSEDRDKVWHEWENAVRQARQFSMKFKMHKKTDGIKNVSSFAIPVKDKDGKVISYLGHITEIQDDGGKLWGIE